MLQSQTSGPRASLKQQLRISSKYKIQNTTRYILPSFNANVVLKENFKRESLKSITNQSRA